MKNNSKNYLKKAVLFLCLLVVCVAVVITHNLLTKRSYAETVSLSYTGNRLSSDLGYNLQADNYYRFSVGTAINADDLHKVDGKYVSTSDKVTVSLTMARKDTGLNNWYAIFVAMFFRVERYNYDLNVWTGDWRYWFCATVHKDGGSHIFDSKDDGDALANMKDHGNYPKTTVKDFSGDENIDLPIEEDEEEVSCIDLITRDSIKGRLTEAATTENTGYSFDITLDGRYRIAISAVAWRFEFSKDNRCWWIQNNLITSDEFFIDNTAPIGTLNGVENGGYTNTDVNFEFLRSQLGSADTFATLDGAAYTSRTNISSEGTHTLVIKDVIKSTTYTFVIDKTAPKGTLHGVEDGGYTNKNVSFEWNKPGTNEAPVSAVISRNYGTKEEYISGTNITEDGFYYIKLEDLAGNTKTYYFTIDKTPPQGTLTGVEDGGYTNKDVKFKWTEDSLKATLNNESYYSGKTISAEGTYVLVLTDHAANSTTYTFTIDKTAPTGTLTNVADGGYTNKDVKFTWTDTEAAATLNGSAYNSGSNVAAENYYTVVLTDLASNSTTYTFTIDRTAPSFIVPVSIGEHTNNNVIVSVADNTVLDSLQYGSSENTNNPGLTNTFVSGRSFTNEGYYNFKATDKAGNFSTYSFVIDKSAPVIAPLSLYTNRAFTVTANDKYGSVSKLEYKLNDGTLQWINSSAVTLGGGLLSNGVWVFRAIDELGNASQWETVNHVFRDTFGNVESIYNSFFTPTYYIVNLSQKNYNSCYGAYSFSEYESALKFAIQKEWECRVIELDGGNSWNYVTPTNENSRQIYTDKNDIDSVIEKYAAKNVSDRKVITRNGSTLNNPTDANGITRPDALTMQVSDLPAVLAAYSGYKFMLAPVNYSLAFPQSVVSGNKSTATIRFISDGISLRIGNEKALEYGTEFKSALDEQGWYLITESDVCGNIEKYLIFIDFQQPDLYAAVTYGNGSNELINFNQSYIDENTETMRFVSFDINSMSDNIDAFVMVTIEGRNLKGQYVFGDELPLLSYENGYYGAYTITAYDRSHNYISFVVYIAGEDPVLRYSSLTNETSCTFTIQINDSYNEITDIKFYKVYFDGTEERILSDSFDTAVCAQNLVYKMNVGGKYVFEFTDLYGRYVRTSPIFYMKGLPSATLRGVKDGGLTKSDVSVIYDLNATAELYILNNGGWVGAELYEISPGISTNSLNITAGKETTGIYKVLLYVTEDRNLFSEYTFEIDGILPFVEIFTESGSPIVAETVTTEHFFVTWQESGYKAYYKKQGALTENSYVKDTFITAAGTYVFTIYDIARNELSFTVALDNTVSYTLDGTYVLLEDGSYITRNNFTFTLTEPWSVFNVETTNGLQVLNGQKLDTDGTYHFYVKDMYGNEFEITLIVDKLPPIPVILTESEIQLSSGARTAEAFKVLCEETNVTLTYSFGSGGFIPYDSALLNDVGEYSFRLSDRVGNVATIIITIDRSVTYRIDGSYQIFDDIIYSKNWILVVPTEATSQFIIKAADGSLLDTSKRISEAGTYKAVIVDLAGNKIELDLVIDKTAPTVQVVTESGKSLTSNESTNENFAIVCTEQDTVISFSRDGSSSTVYDGSYLTENGKYTFTVSDKLGNMTSFDITIDREIRYRIDGEYKQVNGAYCSRTWMLITALENMAVFEIEAMDGSLLDTSKRISLEGVYGLKIEDLAGNKLQLSLIIDKTAPTAQAITKSGKTLSGGAVNEPFRIICEEEEVVITYAINKGNYAVYDGSMMEDAGTYNFIISDYLGNSAILSMLLNYNVSFDVTGTYIVHDGVYYSKSWIQIKPLDDVAEFVIEDEEGTIIDTSKRISSEGTYTVTMQDSAGNKLTFSVVIDKTAPTAQGITESGHTLSNNETTNEKFKLQVGEDDVKITYVFNGVNSGVYSLDFLNERGIYIFTLSDFLGNAAEFRITVDRSVDLTINGTYVINEQGDYVSRNWLSVSLNEKMKVFTLTSEDGTDFGADNRITSEGTYILYAQDNYCNELYLRLVIDKTAPGIDLTGVENKGSTNGKVSISIEGFSEAYYRFNGGDKVLMADNQIFEIEGSYTITAVDAVGNVSNASFDIDKHVDVVPSISLSDGQIITGAISFKFNEELAALLYRNGSEATYFKNGITQYGEYVLTLTDVCGNEKKYNWSIVPAAAKEYALSVPAGALVIAELNGEQVDAVFESDKLMLTENGNYALRFVIGSISWMLELEVDNVAPSIQIENTGKSIKISNPNKEGMTYTLFRDGKQVSFNLRNSAELTETGSYRLVCTDKVGNVTEYSFELNYLNATSIALIILASALVLIGIIVILVLRFRRKVF